MTLQDTLNPAQKEAVDQQEGPVLVLAGAGSGKTRVVTLRIAALLDAGVDPSQILGLTFTNKAAREMKERVLHLTQQAVLICTFHSLGARILREAISLLGYKPSFTIYDEEDVERLLKACIEPLIKSDKALVAEMRKAISSAKNKLSLPDATEDVLKSNDLFTQVYHAYQTRLKECNAVDYDDLLLLPARLFKEFPEVCEHYQDRWKYLLIDEYQDTNAIQYELIRKLVAKSNNICAVGDPDQSIYSWRGADIDNILNFENDFEGSKIIRLEQNYRSTSTILDAANALISHNQKRLDKKLWSAKGAGEKIKLYRSDDERAEARFIARQIIYHYEKDQVPLNEVVVFYRTNAQSRSLEDCFLQQRIPYVVIGGLSFYQRREIKDMLAWLRMVHSGADIVSFERTINLPKRGIGDTTINKLMEGAKAARQTIFAYCETLISSAPKQGALKLTSKQQEGLKQYLHLIRHLRELSLNESLSELLKRAIEITDYVKYLKEDPISYDDRMENLDSLVSKAAEYNTAPAEVTLTQFLEELSLKSTADEEDGSTPKVTLMTMHNGKGLEFTLTFLSGMEEELFPHINSFASDTSMEEERRLCYVGMTRAKEYLYLTYASTRTTWGVTRMRKRSRFLSEIPGEYMERFGSTPSSVSLPSSSPPPQKHTPPPIKTDTETFDVGEWIFHKEFGLGQINEIGESSAGKTYKIMFNKDNRERTLVAKFADLNRV